MTKLKRGRPSSIRPKDGGAADGSGNPGDLALAVAV